MTHETPHRCTLILDSHTVAALALVRGLGRAGRRVVVVREDGKPELAGHSRYADKTITIAPITGNGEAFVREIAAIAQAEIAEAIFPCADPSCFALAQHCLVIDELNRAAEEVAVEDDCIAVQAGLLLPSADALALASDKEQSLKLAASEDVPVPQCWSFASLEAFLAEVESIPLPVVIKPRRSIGADGSRFEVMHAWTLAELRAQFAQLWNAGAEPVIQERADGVGEGLEVLASHGIVVAAGAHRRLREEEITGARSASAVTIPVDETRLQYVRRMVRRLDWHGPVMFEWKVRPDGSAVLLEINGRWWGSLPLAQAAGIDWAELARELAISGKCSSRGGWQAGVRGSYLRAEWRRLKSGLRGKPTGWQEAWPSRAAVICGFLHSLTACPTRFVFAWDDPEPAWFAFRESK